MKKNTKRPKKINNSKVVIIFSFSLSLIIVLYTILNSQLLNSENIEIKGNKYVDEEYIINSLDIKENKNIFRYNIKSMEKKLLNNKYIDKVKIKRILPNTLNINIKEKEIVANLYNGEEYCYIDKEGNFIDNIEEDNTDKNILLVNIEYSLSELEDIKFKNDENKKRLLYLLDYIKNESIYKKIDNIDMRKDNTINMSTKTDIDILVNSDDELKYNISRLAMILFDLENNNQKGGKIDLSNKKHAIYTLKS